MKTKKKKVAKIIPVDLESCYAYLDNVFKPEDIEQFKNTEENEIVIALHHTLGRTIRNEWLLSNEKSPLNIYFKKMGLFHPDDMSTIILRSYHRTLNKKAIKLKQQVQFFIDYWEDAKLDS